MGDLGRRTEGHDDAALTSLAFEFDAASYETSYQGSAKTAHLAFAADWSVASIFLHRPSILKTTFNIKLVSAKKRVNLTGLFALGVYYRESDSLAVLALIRLRAAS